MYGRGGRPLEVGPARAAETAHSSECQHDAGTNVGTDGPPSRDIRLVTARTHDAVRTHVAASGDACSSEPGTRREHRRISNGSTSNTSIGVSSMPPTTTKASGRWT